MCFYEISVHSVMTHQMSLLARVFYKRNPATTCGDFFSTTSPNQRRSTLILKELIFFVNIIICYHTHSSFKLVKSLKTCLGSFLIALSCSHLMKRIVRQ